MSTKKISHWLLKSEPSAFSLDDLAAAPEQSTLWDGVRNHQARRYLGQMQPDDLAFFYHSNARPSGIVGVVRVLAPARPDPADSRWLAVPVQLVERLPRLLSLAELKAEPALAGMMLLRQSRLSVSPLTPAEWATIQRLLSEKN